MSGILQAILNSPAPPAVKVNGSSITSGTYIYNNSNVANTLTVTGTTKAVTLTLWGAAGGNGSYSSAWSSGAGGFAKGTVTLQPGTTYYLYVGQGGFGPASTTGLGGLGGWPNAGRGSQGDASGAGGGGMSMLSIATYSTGMSNSDILLIAGGGGGSTGYAGAAGAGGGTNGQNGTGAITGASQAAGGTYNGSKLLGGNATGGQSGSDDGGGGGGGFYGGGGGTSDAYPGAGGSGYYNASLVTSQTLTTGSTATAPNPDGTLNSSYANGRADVSGTPANGRAGLAYITFS